MERARTAQRQWANLSYAERFEHLNRAADAIEANAEALAVLLSREQGKPLNGPNARFEVGACSAWTRANAAFPVEPEVLVDDESGHAELHWTPIGVVGAIGPWNWPMMISIWQIAPALRMGNTVVLKSSEYTPLFVLGLAHVMNQVLPDGVLRVLAGDGELGRAITAHDGIDKVTFTGSVETGKAIMRSAADDLKRLTLELGGNAAGIVLEDADPKALAKEQFEPALPIIRYDGHSPPRQGAPQVPRGRDGVAVVVMSRGRMSPGCAGTGTRRPWAPLQILTHRMEKTSAVVILGVAAVLFVIGLASGTPASELFRTAVALIVSSMPEALPIVLTVAMGVGVSRMAARNAVARRLPSVEMLGSITVIGSDKTGPLTQNRLTVERIWSAAGFRDLSGVAGARTNEARIAGAGGAEAEAAGADRADPAEALQGNAVDVAMAALALRAGVLAPEDLETARERDMPYEPHLQFSQSMVTEPDGDRVLYVKGAPERVVRFCDRWAGPDGVEPLDGEARQQIATANEQMAEEGLRGATVLGRVELEKLLRRRRAVSEVRPAAAPER